MLEVTGAVGFAARVVLDAIAHGKHAIVMNAELDGTLGPLLKVYADRAGVVYTASEGDQPGVQMNLYRFVRGIGVTPLLCGNVKGLHDPYRNPTTQEGFARRWGQNPYMVTSFADGTKISFEQATVANATGMTVARRGMLGFVHDGPRRRAHRALRRRRACAGWAASSTMWSGRARARGVRARRRTTTPSNSTT